MKIIDDREKKAIKEEWHVGDVIEVFAGDKNFLGMIYQDDGHYRFINLNEGKIVSTTIPSFRYLSDLINEIERRYDIIHKVNAELHIKEMLMITKSIE